ncbi:MAG: Cation-independent mannose-6-phosphate receptor CI-MPR [Candelina mexicana]|nr:MAG: Cation-independent mannose-6-phosphate receptor CI-MPR [Candelina mexicana]
MRFTYSSAALLALYLPILTATASDDKTPKPTNPCTIHSPNTNSFFDLTPISLSPPEEGKKAHKDDRTESWHAKGYDYPANFTINFCAPVIEEVKNVVGVKEELWRNVSAYYVADGKTYSIGSESSEPIFRGRKLVLNYTDGSPCGPKAKRLLDSREELASRKMKGHDGKKDKDEEDDDDDDDGKTPNKGIKRRKSTLISLLCDRDPLSPKASVAFVGASPDECTYFFEARSQAACGGAADTQQSVGPGGVFGLIVMIALLVYVVGGCVYQRTVMQQRGWRQLPNYGLWAGIGSFVRDIFIILTSSCARFLPSRRGYSRVSANSSGGRGRSAPEDENRLIDQLDEEWDD